MDTKNMLTAMIRLSITLSVTGQTWRTSMGRLYRQTMMTRLASFPRLGSMKCTTRKIRLTRMPRLTRLRSLLRG